MNGLIAKDPGNRTPSGCDLRLDHGSGLPCKAGAEMKWRAALGLVALVLVACTGRPNHSSSDRDAIDSRRAAHLQAVNSRDALSVVEGVTPDVVYLAPEAPPFLGQDAYRTMLESAYSSFQPQISMNPQGTEIQGDVAIEWGCLGGTITPLDGGEAIPNTGKYLLVYRRDSTGNWRIAFDAYNRGSCP